MAQKSIIHTKKSCGGKYETEFSEEGFPFLVCDTCGQKLEDWIKWHKEYKDYWQDELRWERKADHLTCILGYFCHRYLDHYGMDFALSLNEKGLFRGPEINILRRVYKALGDNAQAVRKFIDWYFSAKIIRRKKRITSLSFLAAPFTINEFKLHLKVSKRVTRDKKISEGMHKWIKEFAPDVTSYVVLSDYGDLKLLLTHYKNGHFREVDHIAKFVDECKRQGVVNSELEINRWVET